MYKIIPQYPMYEISAYGEIRNCETKSVLRLRQKGRYLTARLSVNGVYKHHNIQRLVALAWIDVPGGYEDMQVAHNDGDSMNNHHSNLRWATPKENTHDKYKHDSFNSPHAEQHHAAKLNKGLVAELRRKIMHGEYDCMDLSLEYNIPKLTIYDAVTGKTWKSVNGIQSPVDLSGRQYKRTNDVRSRVG